MIKVISYLFQTYFSKNVNWFEGMKASVVYMFLDLCTTRIMNYLN